MRGVKLRGEAVKEIPPRLRRPVEDGHVGPAERDGARPRAPVSAHGPDPVLALLDRALHAARGLAPMQLADDRSAVASPAQELRGPHAPKGAPDSENGEPFEKVGLALGVFARQEVEPGGRREGEGGEVPEIGELYRANVHPISAPMPAQILMGMITQSDP